MVILYIVCVVSAVVCLLGILDPVSLGYYPNTLWGRIRGLAGDPDVIMGSWIVFAIALSWLFIGS